MANYLITGGAGFIGSHLACSLREAGHAISVLDNFSTGQTSNIGPDTKIIEGNITNRPLLQKLVKQVDGVFHLAAISSVQRYVTDWSHSTETNLGGTLTVFEAAAAAQIPVVYASSAAVYGAADNLPLSENIPPQPISGYGIDKYACELHASAMAEALGLISVGLRFFNVYGPGQLRESSYSGVITIFLDKWVKGEPLTVFGDGTQSRDFVYVGDVADALVRAMSYAETGGSDVINICSGHATSINELIDSLARSAKTKFTKQSAPTRPGEIHASKGCPEKAAKVLNFRTNTGLDAGLKHLIEWFSREEERRAAGTLVPPKT
ncbi:NAD-dependent epimerase/dehydratase family protein [Pseudohalocynthiibacter sp. F2068]|jgi:UDP-glucose 4-epimerase|uniref:NAD-dependent epimerase/dehydratase family protein n=1 Tax=Pseudohalocynthiibacter sp. F2068 TaxID=2926418 RepID=UPI001FF3E12A|nr:NAD-dependent epimerase/dehydratase family protein [Pseudohalocynthiibacter sp. F2068]MCK0104301.1 NAD-dependent epimerase/dehydratase family protein [Pseudohalocynthiibacter sp. F2068]